MTPFGQRVREMRAARGLPLKSMAHAVGVSPAYLSALEHGRRGAPTWFLVQRIITYFNVIWDEADELEKLAHLSHPRVTVDTSGMHPIVTEAANRFAQSVGELNEDEAAEIIRILQRKARSGPA